MLRKEEWDSLERQGGRGKMQPEAAESSSLRHTLVVEPGNWDLHLSTERERMGRFIPEPGG